ncbi:hypothetical protein [Thaumasiovibrio sp. DFM-14]
MKTALLHLFTSVMLFSILSISGTSIGVGLGFWLAGEMTHI